MSNWPETLDTASESFNLQNKNIKIKSQKLKRKKKFFYGEAPFQPAGLWQPVMVNWQFYDILFFPCKDNQQEKQF